MLVTALVFVTKLVAGLAAIIVTAYGIVGIVDSLTGRNNGKM